MLAVRSLPRRVPGARGARCERSVLNSPPDKPSHTAAISDTFPTRHIVYAALYASNCLQSARYPPAAGQLASMHANRGAAPHRAAVTSTTPSARPLLATPRATPTTLWSHTHAPLAPSHATSSSHPCGGQPSGPGMHTSQQLPSDAGRPHLSSVLRAQRMRLASVLTAAQAQPAALARVDTRLAHELRLMMDWLERLSHAGASAAAARCVVPALFEWLSRIDGWRPHGCPPATAQLFLAARPLFLI